jgi:hypothetical protein
MSNRSVPNLESLKHASEAKKLMLAKFKMSLVDFGMSASPPTPDVWLRPS